MKHVIFSTGTFNFLHCGHTKFLQQARNLGDELVLFLDSDKRNEKLKGNKAIFSWYERKALLEALSSVDSVLKFDEISEIGLWIHNAVKNGKSLVFVKARDYDLNSLDKELMKELDQYKVPITFLPYNEKYSTTKIFEKIREQK